MLWIALVSIHNAFNCVTIDCKAATIDYLNAHGTNLRKAKMSLVEHARQLHKILASTAYHKILAVKASRCFDWLLYWHFEQYSSGRCPARMVGKSQHQTHQTNGKIQWENPDALRTAPSQRTQTKHNNDNDNNDAMFLQQILVQNHLAAVQAKSRKAWKANAWATHDGLAFISSISSITNKETRAFHIFPSE